jgi:hypothetical protein
VRRTRVDLYEKVRHAKTKGVLTASLHDWILGTQDLQAVEMEERCLPLLIPP